MTAIIIHLTEDFTPDHIRDCGAFDNLKIVRSLAN
jgi:hypothetical protein